MNDREMSLTEHLDELRTRLLWSLYACTACLMVAFILYDPWVLNLLRVPLDTLNRQSLNPFVPDTVISRFLRSLVPAERQGALVLHFIGPLEVFLTRMKASFYAGVVLASPVVTYQIWRFVGVALTPAEQRLLRLFFPVSVVLFLAGVGLGHFFVMPCFLYVLVVSGAGGVEPLLIVSKYVSLVALGALMFGLLAELPLILLALVRLGFVSPATLVRQRKVAIVLMAIVAAIVTPPDGVTMLLTMVPMLLLYEASIWIARLANVAPANPGER